LIETLEGRMMLSAAPAAAHHPHPQHTAVHANQKPAHQKAPAGTVDPIFMQIKGLTGDVTVNGFLGDIQLNSLQWGVGRGIGSPTEGSTDRQISAPSISEVVITKASDQTSPALLGDILNATDIPEVDISFVNLNRNTRGGQVYAKYVLSNVLLSGYSLTSSGDRPSESLSLNFTKIQYTLYTQNPNGTTTAAGTVGYDLTQGKTV
jgi:type VI secretion system secreted protein Hcp